MYLGNIINFCKGLTALGIVFLSISASAAQGDWLVRLRGIAIVPQDDSGLIALHTGAPGTNLSDSGVEVDMAIVPELDITYMSHQNWGIEAIAGFGVNYTVFQS